MPIELVDVHKIVKGNNCLHRAIRDPQDDKATVENIQALLNQALPGVIAQQYLIRDERKFNKFGEAPLLLAISYKKFKTALFLLEQGASPIEIMKEKKEEKGDNILHLLSIHFLADASQLEGFEKILDYLIQKELFSGLARQLNHLCMSPLHYAAFRKQKNVIEIFIRKGVDRHIQDNEGNTPLHIAVSVAYPAPIEAEILIAINALLANKCSFTIRNKKNKTPLSMAQEYKNSPNQDESHVGELILNVIKEAAKDYYKQIKEFHTSDTEFVDRYQRILKFTSEQESNLCTELFNRYQNLYQPIFTNSMDQYQKEFKPISLAIITSDEHEALNNHIKPNQARLLTYANNIASLQSQLGACKEEKESARLKEKMDKLKLERDQLAAEFAFHEAVVKRTTDFRRLPDLILQLGELAVNPQLFDFTASEQKKETAATSSTPTGAPEIKHQSSQLSHSVFVKTQSSPNPVVAPSSTLTSMQPKP